MEKFFNLNENPFTMDLDLTQIEYYMDKADGSLISTYLDNGVLYTKSKTSVFSSQSIAAEQFLNDWVHQDLRTRCTELAKNGYTCNFEYVSPNNRIVLPYEKAELILLNVRHNVTGEYVEHVELMRDPILRRYLVKSYTVVDGPEFVQSVYDMWNIEGFVFKLRSGQFFKVKTNWYSDLHAVKSSISNNKMLFTVCRAGRVDDIRMMFSDDASIKKINIFEKIFIDYVIDSMNELQSLHKLLHGRSRKEYAIQSQTHFTQVNKPYLFSTFMNLYNGMIDLEELVEIVSDIFIKYVDQFVPDEYKNVE